MILLIGHEPKAAPANRATGAENEKEVTCRQQHEIDPYKQYG